MKRVLLVLVLMFSTGAAVADFTANDNPLHLWNLNGSGTDNGSGLIDIVTLANGARYDRWMNGIDFSADVTAYAAPEPANLPMSVLLGGGAFTIEAIVCPALTPGAESSHMEIVSAEDGSTRAFQFRMNDGGTTLRFQTLTSGFTTTVAYDVPITYEAGKWYHAAVTYSGVPNVAGNLKIYWTPLGEASLIEVTAASPQTMTGTINPDRYAEFCIGNELRASPGENWEGVIDAVRITETERSPAAMLASIVPPLTPPAETPITGMFFENGTGEEYTTVINGNFTLPGTASKGTTGVPGWYGSQTAWSSDTGTRSGDSSDGDNWNFSEKIADGPIWNVTQTRMVEGRSYTFLADVQGRWDCNRVTMSVIAGEDPNTGLGDPNIPLASVTHVIGGNGVWYHDLFVSYTATEADAGKFIGVKFEGGSTTNVNNSWIRYDNVRMVDGSITIKHGPLDPIPADEAVEVAPGSFSLHWTPSNDPNKVAQNLYYYIGTGKSFDIAAYRAVSPVSLSASANSCSIGTVGYDQYVLWRVDTVIDGAAYTGPTWYFMMQTTDFPPTVDAGYSYITWLGNLPQLLAGTVDDGGEGDVADADVVWSIISGPSGAAATVVKTSTDPLQPTAMFTTDKAGDYVIELTAADTNGSQGVQSASDRLTVRVAADACAAQQIVQAGYNAADYDRNCVVDLADLSAFARQWLDDIRLSSSVPY